MTPARTRLTTLIPSSLRPALRKLYYLPFDAIDRLRHGAMVPPRSMNFIGGGDFVGVGDEFKRYFMTLGDLQPHHTVLDVGCGIGRMALPLTEYLSPEGQYWGFDIVKLGIDWCNRRITPKFPNFHFLHSDVYSRHYNAGGTTLARDYRYPFADDTFDFAFLTSVFTHMLPADLENYLRELSRVLRPGGRCLVTFFLLNDESRSLIGSHRSTLDFAHALPGGCMTTDDQDPEAAIAYEETAVDAMFASCRLRVIQPVHYGSWCGRNDFLSYQDIVIATKLGTGADR
jgi:SAM-dependent methyltransferase